MSSKEFLDLLIIEKSTADLNPVTTGDGAVFLEGIFTELGVKNKNNRIYEEGEVIPHIKLLQEKIKKGKLLGELDHPKDFDISLSNVSHVIEDISFDPTTKQIKGKIRLLNTTKGKEAQALVADGIPLHISSRAAGNVTEGNKVKIKKLFTYDLVADPGFENAQLNRVNESLGYDTDDTLFIYEMNHSHEEDENKNKKSKMTNEQFVSVEDFNRYTEYLKTEINSLKEAFASKDGDRLEKLIKYTEHIAENVNNVIQYTEYIAENVDNSIEFSDYLSENLNNMKSYATYLAEELDNSIQYTENVAEGADKGIEYANYLAEKIDQSIQYSESIAEGADKGIEYATYLAEKLNESIAYSEYLKENVESGIGYAEYIAEQINSEYENALNESRSITESTNTNSYKDSINEKLGKLLEREENTDKMKFLTFLNKERTEEFHALDESSKEVVIKSMNDNRCLSTVEADAIWESVFSNNTTLDFIKDMPGAYKERWESLSESKKSQIIAESKMYNLNTPYQIKNFWGTRDLREVKVDMEKINENKQIATPVSGAVSDDFKRSLIDKVKMNTKRA